MQLPTIGFPEVKLGDVIYTMEARALFDDGGCGETITQKTTYDIISIDNVLLAKCRDYEKISKLSELMSCGQCWHQTGYRLDD